MGWIQPTRFAPQVATSLKHLSESNRERPPAGAQVMPIVGRSSDFKAEVDNYRSGKYNVITPDVQVKEWKLS